ncbi:MAG TPA: amino acid permease, partial [Candidatus Glassbacteria bacterium]|nr:amino acid permease [Candidatus Glassbacteria bacterium]
AAAARRSRSFGTPAAALTIQAVYVSLLIFIGSFDQLLSFCGFLLSLFSALTVSAVFVLRRRFPELPRPFRAPGYPYAPAFYLIVSLWMMCYSIISRPAESLIGLAIIVAGLPVYALWRRKRRSG